MRGGGLIYGDDWALPPDWWPATFGDAREAFATAYSILGEGSNRRHLADCLFALRPLPTPTPRPGERKPSTGPSVADREAERRRDYLEALAVELEQARQTGDKIRVDAVLRALADAGNGDA